jgi:hypothetical protein
MCKLIISLVDKIMNSKSVPFLKGVITGTILCFVAICAIVGAMVEIIVKAILNS